MGLLSGGAPFGPISHLGMLPAAYIGASVVFAAQVAGVPLASPAGFEAVAAAFCTGLGAYLLDRVKIRDAWLDPADAAAQPERYDFLTRRVAGGTLGVRAILAGSFGAAAAIGGAMGAWRGWPAWIPAVAAGGVVAYAGFPRGSGRRGGRPKDLLLVKNIYTGAGVAGLAVLLTLEVGRPGAAPMTWFSRQDLAAIAFAGAVLFLRAVADAALCDLDDEAADKRFGTTTLPSRLGRRRAWGVGMLIRLASAAALVVVPLGPAEARWAWAGAMVLTSAVMRWAAPRMVGDWVDFRFMVEAVLVSAVLRMRGG